MSMTLAEMVATARSEAREISPAQAAEANNRSELALIVDVREPSEYEQSHVPGAINIPRGLLDLRADKGPSARSLLAAQTLSSMGYEHVEVLGGGLNAWAEAGLPVEARAQPATA